MLSNSETSEHQNYTLMLKQIFDWTILFQAFAAEFGFYRGSNKFDDATCPAIVQTTFAYTNKHGQRKLR